MADQVNEIESKTIDPPFQEQKQMRTAFDEIFRDVTGMIRTAEENVKDIHKK